MKGPRVLERQVKRACQEALAARRIFAWRTNSGGMKNPRGQYVQFAGVSGLADLIGLLAPTGRFLAVEVKRPGEQPTDEQRAFLNRVNDAGGLGIWTDDPDDMLDQIEKGRPLR
jgi:hypothetical protein